MSVSVDIAFNWSSAATGLLTNAKIVTCMDFAAHPPETDPQFIYQGGSSMFQATYIADDEGPVPALPFIVTVDGVESPTSGTKWMRYDWSDLLQECIRGYFHGGASPITVVENMLKFGYVIFNTANATVTLNNLDHSIMYDPFAGMQQQVTAGMNRVVAHTAAGTSAIYQSITPGKLYFYEELKLSTSGECKIRFRDPDSGFAILNTLEIAFTPSIYGTYADLWGSQSSHPDTTGDVLYGNTFYQYNPTGFLDVFEGNINTTTLNAATLRIG